MHHCHILHRYKKVVLILLSLILPFYLYAQQPAFRVVPLGVLGGLDESNLSAYMVAPYQSNNYVCLDAGTLHAGIAKAVTGHVFNIPAEDVLKRYIKGYLISHPHLDHLAGLVINSPADTAKNIYALQSCIDVLKRTISPGKAGPILQTKGRHRRLENIITGF